MLQVAQIEVEIELIVQARRARRRTPRPGTSASSAACANGWLLTRREARPRPDRARSRPAARPACSRPRGAWPPPPDGSDRKSLASMPSDPDSRQKRISSAVLSVEPGYTLQARRLHVTPGRLARLLARSGTDRDDPTRCRSPDSSRPWPGCGAAKRRNLRRELTGRVSKDQSSSSNRNRRVSARVRGHRE